MNQGALCSTFQEVADVGVDDVRVATEQQLFHLNDCLRAGSWGGCVGNGATAAWHACQQLPKRTPSMR